MVGGCAGGGGFVGLEVDWLIHLTAWVRLLHFEAAGDRYHWLWPFATASGAEHRALDLDLAEVDVGGAGGGGGDVADADDGCDAGV